LSEHRKQSIDPHGPDNTYSRKHGGLHVDRREFPKRRGESCRGGPPNDRRATRGASAWSALYTPFLATGDHVGARGVAANVGENGKPSAMAVACRRDGVGRASVDPGGRGLDDAAFDAWRRGDRRR
jgi:hypothetical protein